MAENIEELHRKIKELEKEIAYLNDQLKQDDKFGLHWIDVPEAFDKESENKIPILEEVPELAITNDDGKPTHILIEGDNYHALTCLNYTHHGKIDVIYIDPPYNTGSDGFTYKDKRFLDTFPDGVKLPLNHPLRHSTWLSFMKKRLKLAKDLLSDRGVIFISIDDNELAELKLLCDSPELFGVDNFVANIVVETANGVFGTRASQVNKTIVKVKDYVLVYLKNKKLDRVFQPLYMPTNELFDTHYSIMLDEQNNRMSFIDYLKKQKVVVDLFEKYNIGISLNNVSKVMAIDNDFVKYIYQLSTDIYQDVDYSLAVPEKIDNLLLQGKTVLYNDSLLFRTKNGAGEIRQYISLDKSLKMTDTYEPKYQRAVAIGDLWEGFDEDMKNVAKEGTMQFKNGKKPVRLIKQLIKWNNVQNAIVLDFFAGSGTTMHSTMMLNDEDGGHRQCILVNSNEANICRNVTYERNKRVIKGVNVPPLGNSLKYYRTSFVGSNDSNRATDEDKTILSQKAGCLLALAENTLYEKVTTDNYQIFKDKDKEVWTAVYFKEDYRPKFFNEFVDALSKLKGKKNVYIFSWGDVCSFEAYFDNISDINIKSIPQPILDIYKSLNS